MYGPPGQQPPIRAIQDSGIVWGLGTDATIVAHYQPFITLGWVVTGKSINGQTVIENPITREEALIAHTRANAFLMFKEDDIGTLEVGKFADLVVLDRDYMSVPADEIFNIESVLTMVGGRVVYEAVE
jgi:predicted amidohydrolase YtcJ